jgi:hypothetical protein
MEYRMTELFLCLVLYICLKVSHQPVGGLYWLGHTVPLGLPILARPHGMGDKRRMKLT